MATTIALPRRRFPFRPGQVAVWQLAAAGVLLTGGPFSVRGGIVAGAAALAVVSTAVRWRGRWGYQWLWLALRWTRRDRSAPLSSVLPPMRFQTYADRAGNRTGVAGDGRSYTAVLRVGRVDPGRLTAALRGAYERVDPPVAAVQTLVWTVPVPGGEPVRSAWLAVRFAAGAATEAVTARGGGEPGAVRATAVAALALARDLADAGLPVAVLDGESLRDQLAVALGVPPGAAAKIRTRWQQLDLGGLRQTCYRPRPGTDPAVTLTASAPEPATFTAASLTLSRPTIGTEPVVSTVIRVGTPAGNPVPTDPPLHRMDGDHIAGLRASVPLGLAV